MNRVMQVGPRTQRGFTAVEVIVVMIVGMVILAVAASNIEGLFGGSNLTEEVSNTEALYSNTKALKTSSGYGTAGSLIGSLIATNGVPKNMVFAGGTTPTITNAYGGSVAVDSTGLGFTITQGGLPRDACIKLATKIAKSGIFSSIKIGTATAVVGEYATATATNDCSGTSNSIVFTSGS